MVVKTVCSGKEMANRMRLSQKGQSLIEFALIIPILLLTVMGIFDLGRLFYIKIALSSAAREGAYYLSYTPDDYPTNTGTYAAIQYEADNLGVDVDPVTDVTISGCCTSGSAVEITISQTVNLAVFSFITGPVDLTSSVRMMVQ